MQSGISRLALTLIYAVIYLSRTEFVSTEEKKLNKTIFQKEIQIAQNNNYTSGGCDIPLNYTEQFCVVENSTLRDCLVQRANLIDNRMCEEKRPYSANRFTCQYAEICIFTVPAELEGTCIEHTHNCTVRDFDNVTCHSATHLSFNTRCYISFVYCPIGKYCRRELEGIAIKELYQSNGTCSDVYERVFNRSDSWYWINQDHFNNDSGGFGDLQLINSPRDHCEESTFVLSKGPHWHLIPIVTAVFVLLVFITIGILKLRKFILSTYPENSKEDMIFIQLSSIFAALDSATNQSPPLSSLDEVEIAEPIDTDLRVFPQNSLPDRHGRTERQASDPINSSSPLPLTSEIKTAEFPYDGRSRLPLSSVTSSILTSVSNDGASLSPNQRTPQLFQYDINKVSNSYHFSNEQKDIVEKVEAGSFTNATYFQNVEPEICTIHNSNHTYINKSNSAEQSNQAISIPEPNDFSSNCFVGYCSKHLECDVVDDMVKQISTESQNIANSHQTTHHQLRISSFHREDEREQSIESAWCLINPSYIGANE